MGRDARYFLLKKAGEMAISRIEREELVRSIAAICKRSDPIEYHELLVEAEREIHRLRHLAETRCRMLGLFSDCWRFLRGGRMMERTMDDQLEELTAERDKLKDEVAQLQKQNERLTSGLLRQRRDDATTICNLFEENRELRAQLVERDDSTAESNGAGTLEDAATT